MGEWANPWAWMGGTFLLFIGWLLYDVMRPVKDYYVLQRHYFDRLYEEPWRGQMFAAHYHGFEDYLAAKTLFDRNEHDYNGVLDDSRQEAEHTLFLVPARNKLAAVKSLKTGKAYPKELLLQTPFREILKRRKYWREEITRLQEVDRIEDEAARSAAAMN
jgi:hypothetical protein